MNNKEVSGHCNAAPDLKPFTLEKLIHRIEKSELDFKNVNFKSQEDLEKTSANW